MNTDEHQIPQRDGTSQAGRQQMALAPAYVSVDERSVADLLSFARAYAKELRYFNEQNEAEGDWSRFLDGDLDAMVRYLGDPERFQSAATNGRPSPHLVLLLTFLDLLQYPRAQLNDLTRRHLEFYYREALRLTNKLPTPDHVHVLVDLADGQNQYRLAAGSLLSAGQDSQGTDLFYQTDHDLVANQASVASLKSLFVQKQVIGIPEAHKEPDLVAALFPTASASWQGLPLAERAFMSMLSMALGEPDPGDALPPYPDTGHPPDTALLTALDKLIAFIQSDLAMSLSSFRTLMELKNKRDASDAQWNVVNDILKKAGTQRDAHFQWDASAPRNFEKNLLAVLGLADFNTFFNTLPEVNDIYDLYRLRARTEVREFIEKDQKLFMSFDDFVTMMAIIDDIYKDWRRIYDLLRKAARNKAARNKAAEPQLGSPNLHAYVPNKFDTLTTQTLGALTFPSSFKALMSLDDCYRQLMSIEPYFHMAVEDFAVMREINARGAAAKPWEQEQIYAILEQAHVEKVLPTRWKALADQQHDHGFDAMILFALGDPAPGDPLPESKHFMDLDPVRDETYIREQLFLEVANFEYIKNAVVNKEQAAAVWDTVYKMLELAERRKRGWEEPRAEIERWENIYAAADATTVQVRVGPAEAAVTPRWRTFGASPSPSDQTSVVPAAGGFAVASPLLALAEGDRTITLMLSFDPAHFDQTAVQAALAATPFHFFVSAQDSMIEVIPTAPQDGTPAGDVEPIKSADGTTTSYTLTFILHLGVQAPPVTPLTTNDGIRTPWPMLQIRLASVPAANDLIYRAFQPLTLKKVHLQVDAAGLTQLTVENDDGVLNAKKPFEPFGIVPVVGSSFYIAHPELCSKKLDRLDMSIDWLAVPDNLHDYYQGYQDYENPKTPPTSPITDNTAFKGQVRLYDNRAFFDIQVLQLFHADDVKTTGAAKTNVISIDGNATKTTYQLDPQPVSTEEVRNWSRYWQVELLAPDFQHAIYPRAAAGYANRKKADGTFDPFIVNPPYTPKIKRLSMGYGASVEIDLAASGSRPAATLYHIESFGYRELVQGNVGPYYFLPQHVNEGELFVGLAGLTPPQNLSLLFQMAEGSADPSVAREAVHWNYLSGNGWESLERGRLLSDTTNGLLNTGIVVFDLPPVAPSTLLPAGLYWLQATIAKNSRGIADLVAIAAQAVRATFTDRGNAPDHLSQPLPPASITGLAEPQPEVRAIRQPYSSSGGQGPEQAGRFYTRVSERLRHKNRALTSWDYERMILEACPEIYKVKCLPVGIADDPRLADQIQVIVIPDIRGKLPFDPYEPKVGADMLAAIKQYLDQHTPPAARFTVSNPVYIRLEIRLGVRLRPGFNPGYYLQALNQELQHYLAPWAYDHSAEIVFGGKINANLIVNFVEERPYVDYVAGIKLFTSRGDDVAPEQVAPQFAVAPDAILVSYRQHQIDLITGEVYQEAYFTGINYLEIELDFQVA